MNDLELLKHILNRPIAFHKVFFDVTQDMKAAIFLSQLYYWSETMKRGWFYKTAESWGQETGLSPKEQRRVRKILLAKNLIQEQKKGVPATIYFKFNFEIFISVSREYYSQLGTLGTSEETQENSQLGTLGVTANGHIQLGTLGTSITEITTEITNNKKEKRKKTDLPFDAEQVVELYNKILPELPSVKVLTSQRISALKKAIKAWPNSKEVDWWGKYFEAVRAEKWILNGSYTIGFDYLIRTDKLIGIVEKLTHAN